MLSSSLFITSSSSGALAGREASIAPKQVFAVLASKAQSVCCPCKMGGINQCLGSCSISVPLCQNCHSHSSTGIVFKELLSSIPHDWTSKAGCANLQAFLAHARHAIRFASHHTQSNARHAHLLPNGRKRATPHPSAKALSGSPACCTLHPLSTATSRAQYSYG